MWSAVASGAWRFQPMSRNGSSGRAATRVESELGPIDVWVNDAMDLAMGPTIGPDNDGYGD